MSSLMRTRTMRKKLEERSATAAAPAAAASAGGRSAPPPAASQAFRLHIPSRRHSPHGGGALQLPPLSLRSKKAKATPRENQPGAHLKTPRVRVPKELSEDSESGKSEQVGRPHPRLRPSARSARSP
jgi:hypothetical protein